MDATIFLLVVFSIACLVSSAPSPSCNQVLNEKNVCNLIRLPDDAESQGTTESYKVLYNKGEVTLMELQRHNCHISRTQTLRLALDRTTSVTDILIANEETLVPKFMRVTLRLGNTSHECEFSGNSTNRFGKSFSVFPCHAAFGGYTNEIVIKSVIHRVLTLADNQQPEGLTLNWLVISSDRAKRSAFDDTTDKRGTNEYGSGGQLGSKIKCPPVQPYRGMPESYSNYELVEGGLINELLLRSPCRDGFKFIGQLSGINQCKNGIWQGNGFPECEVLRTRTPPAVNHATWSYVNKDTFHEILYTCQDGYYLPNNTGTTVTVTYRPELDNWSGIPECKKPDSSHFTMDNWPIFVSTAGATLALTGVFLAIYVLVKRMAASKQKKLSNLRAPKDLSATLHKPAFACQESDKKITKESLQQQKRSETLLVGKEDAYTKILDVKEEGVHNDNGYMKTNDLLQRNFGHEEPAYEEIDGDKTKLLSSSPVKRKGC